MIIGLGTDLVELERIRRVYEKWHIKFLNRFLREEELLHMPTSPITWIAGRFAAKEACAKALGTGFQNGILWQDLLILPDKLGKPQIFLKGKALERAKDLGVHAYHLSISHEKTMACAIVIMEGQ